jgi:hypothetical protein
LDSQKDVTGFSGRIFAAMPGDFTLARGKVTRVQVQFAIFGRHRLGTPASHNDAITTEQGAQRWQ